MTRVPARCNRKRRRHTQRSQVPPYVQVIVKVKDTPQQNACKAVCKDKPDNSRDKPQHSKLYRKDTRDARTGSAQRLQNHNLANTSIPCPGNRTRKNDNTREGTETREKLNNIADLQQHLAHRLDSSRNINDSDRRIVLIESTAQLSCRCWIAMQASIPCDRQAAKCRLRQNKL